jgi:hypothetical protein
MHIIWSQIFVDCSPEPFPLQSVTPKKFVLLYILDLNPYGSSFFLLPYASVRNRMPPAHMHCLRLQPITGLMLTEPHARCRHGLRPVSLIQSEIEAQRGPMESARVSRRARG